MNYRGVKFPSFCFWCFRNKTGVGEWARQARLNARWKLRWVPPLDHSSQEEYNTGMEYVQCRRAVAGLSHLYVLRDHRAAGVGGHLVHLLKSQDGLLDPSEEGSRPRDGAGHGRLVLRARRRALAGLEDFLGYLDFLGVSLEHVDELLLHLLVDGRPADSLLFSALHAKCPYYVVLYMQSVRIV